MEEFSIENPLRQSERLAGSIFNVLTGESGEQNDTLNLYVNLKVQNDNDFQVSLRSLDYKLFLDDREIGKGNYSGPDNYFAIQAHSADILHLPINLSLAETTFQFYQNLVNQKLKFDFWVKVTLYGKFGSKTIDLVLNKDDMTLQPSRL